MDIAAILVLIEKGITVAEALLAAGQEVGPAFQAIKALVTGAKNGTVTDQQLSDTETLLDGMIDDFNLDIE